VGKKIISKRGKPKQVPQPSPLPGLPTTGDVRIIIDKDGKWTFPDAKKPSVPTRAGSVDITHIQPEND